ncbi:MAG: RNA ligase, partial [Planctomycetota bacterium]|nr:RNA ligase [Planctomycetota bacterium]
IEQSKATCRDSAYNLNLVTIEDGMIRDCFKGLPDETNNALFQTYSLHQDQQLAPSPIQREVLRVVPLKIVRGTRLILSMLTRTSYRVAVKAALRSLDQSLRMETLASIDFQTLRLSVDQWKSIAFQLGQMVALIRGQELYSKSHVRDIFPGLQPFIDRQILGVSASPINDYRDELVELVSDVYTRQDGPLNLFCYISSVKVKEWNRYTLQCRGTIIDLKSERVVAFPYEKFFKWNELDGWREQDFSSPPLELVEKVDGSFVTAFQWQGELRFACKGNFDAEQSRRAKALSSRYDLSNFDFQRNSYTFEVVYPENRFPQGFASVDYGAECLYLTGIRDLQSGDILPYSQVRDVAQAGGLRWPQVYQLELGEVLELSKEAEWTNFEGWVANFAGKRVKIKTRGYSQLNELFNSLRHGRHRILKDYVRLTTAQWLEKLSILPEDMRPLFDAEVDLFIQSKKDLEEELASALADINKSLDIGDFHHFVLSQIDQRFHKILFRMKKGQDCDALMEDLVLRALLKIGRESQGLGCQRVTWELLSSDLADLNR